VDHVLADLRSDRLQSVRRLGKPAASYRKVTFHKEHLDQDKHLDAVLLGTGHSLYAAIDERLNEALTTLTGGCAFYLDSVAQAPYRLYLFEMAVRGQKVNGDPETIFAELVAVREDPQAPPPDRFSMVPADSLLDLPAHPNFPAEVDPVDATPAADYLKSTYQMQVRTRCQQDRQHFVEVCRDYLTRSFDARIRAAMDRVMNLRAREADSPDVSLARQRAENDLADLQRTQKERMEGLQRLNLARHGPVRHLATALVFPPGQEAAVIFPDELDPEIRRKSELAAEDVVVAYEQSRGWTCERIGHLKIGFDIRSLGPADSQTGYRGPVAGIRRIEVKGRKRGMPIRLTTNEWYKAAQLGDSYWLYVIWDPLDNPNPDPVRIQNPVKHLDHAKKEVVAARYFDIPAEAVDFAARNSEA